ncbi:hypothetical protein MTBBW1_1410024 [Desulfamplus magnetovallimortis]|uniref:Uncharacterized protein n=1 Tax=Desulfamplus magnetovallimortis TaxID=1246637 RepID=A0A1W1H802_9BACT|nr:hypothetical protein MTBBW1_1410024 [Desulfamplus magnetovallimortis]
MWDKNGNTYTITYMADDRHNRKDESHLKNRLLPRLSYKNY